MTSKTTAPPLPRHIAIIMDGNGRWAMEKKLHRIDGHREGIKAVRRTVEACSEIGIDYLTLFAFSSENWSRPQEEINALMDLLCHYLRSECQEMMERNIRLISIGDHSQMPDFAQRELNKTIETTSKNTGLTLNLALSYGGRDEIVTAARRLALECAQGRVKPQEIDQSIFSKFLYTSGLPDPDLLIRTSGEYRISNFLLWQTAYTELYITDILWPDFNKEQLLVAIKEFQGRERRFGLTSEQLKDL